MKDHEETDTIEKDNPLYETILEKAVPDKLNTCELLYLTMCIILVAIYYVYSTSDYCK